MKISIGNGLCSLILLATPLITLADPDESQLTKVTPGMQKSCVEYYTYRGALYCSTKALSSQSIDPDIKNFETQTIVFDDRPWQAVWGQKKDTHTTVEYVPMGDDINDWNELVTSQFFPGLQTKTTPEEFAKTEIKGLEEMGFKPIVTVIQNDKNNYLFEFRVESPQDQAQDEIQKVTEDQDGIYVLHYAIKQSDMGKERRELWIKNLSNSEIK